MFKEINDPIYGPKFKELRKQANKSLVETAKGITSKSSLARWENGSDNLSFGKVIELLHRIYIQPSEFLGSDIPSQTSALYREAMVAYCNNNISLLKQLSNKYLNLYSSHPQEKNYFFQAAISCDLYEDLTEKIYFHILVAQGLMNIFPT